MGGNEYLRGDGRFQIALFSPFDVGEKQKMNVEVQNDGDFPSRYRLHGGRSNADYKVKYGTGGTNITRKMKRGTYKTPRLDLQESTTLKLKVTAKTQDGANSAFIVEILGAAAKDPGDLDLVGAEHPQPGG